jgi:hypothetical protein
MVRGTVPKPPRVPSAPESSPSTLAPRELPSSARSGSANLAPKSSSPSPSQASPTSRRGRSPRSSASAEESSPSCSSARTVAETIAAASRRDSGPSRFSGEPHQKSRFRPRDPAPPEPRLNRLASIPKDDRGVSLAPYPVERGPAARLSPGTSNSCDPQNPSSPEAARERRRSWYRRARWSDARAAAPPPAEAGPVWKLSAEANETPRAWLGVESPRVEPDG